MALKGNAATKFEDPAPPAPATVATPAPAPATPAPTASASTQVAVPVKAGLPVASGGKFTDFFAQFANALPPVGFGTLPRLIGTNGFIFVKGNNTPDVKLGERIEISLLSFHDEYVLSPGGDSAPKELVKYSLDGETIEGTGQPCAAYIEYLVAQGYKDAKKKRYVHLLGTLEHADQKTDLIGDIVDVSISPDGVKPWEGYRLQRSAKISRGGVAAEGSERISVTALAKSGNGRNWVSLVVGPAQSTEVKQAA